MFVPINPFPLKRLAIQDFKFCVLLEQASSEIERSFGLFERNTHAFVVPAERDSLVLLISDGKDVTFLATFPINLLPVLVAESIARGLEIVPEFAILPFLVSQIGSFALLTTKSFLCQPDHNVLGLHRL